MDLVVLHQSREIVEPLGLQNQRKSNPHYELVHALIILFSKKWGTRCSGDKRSRSSQFYKQFFKR
jgi:hypothetical protein